MNKLRHSMKRFVLWLIRITIGLVVRVHGFGWNTKLAEIRLWNIIHLVWNRTLETGLLFGSE